MKRGWDEYDAYLFDVDGTLLHCSDAVHYFAFCHVLTEIAKRPLNLDGVVAHGNVDIGILRDALLLAGIADSEWRQRVPEMCRQLCCIVQENRSGLRIEPLAGAFSILAHLRSQGAILAVATGNLEAIARLKLESCGLADCFDFGGFSDGCESRTQVVARALAEAKRRTSTGAAICLVGDTPSDVKAARAHGIDVIAVASGIFGADDLRDEAPDLLINSLEDLLRTH